MLLPPLIWQLLEEESDEGPKKLPSELHRALVDLYTQRYGTPPTAEEQLPMFARQLLLEYEAKVRIVSLEPRPDLGAISCVSRQSS